MRRSYLEAVFRHPLLVVMPLLLATGLGIGSALSRPALDVSTASVWTDRPITDEFTVGTTGGDSPPSAGQQALMTKYLATRSFLLAVAKASPIPQINPSGPAVEVEPALAKLAGSITTNTPGPNLMTVAVRQPSAQGARGVAKAVVEEFLRRERGALRARAGASVAYANAHETQSAQSLDSAQIELSRSLRTHPLSQNGVDGKAESLRSAVNRVQAEYLAAASDAQARAAPVVDKNTLSTQDVATPAAPLGRRRKGAIAGMAGLLVGPALAVAAMVLLVSRGDKRRRRHANQPMSPTAPMVIRHLAYVGGGALQRPVLDFRRVLHDLPVD